VSDGSGYDVACADAESPLRYQLDGDTIQYTEIDFGPPFRKHLYFVYLNQKASSPDAVRDYLKKGAKRRTLVKSLTEITENIINCRSMSEFCRLLEAHENLVAKVLEMPTVKSKYFKDFDGAVKSLGAWGGDFILACSDSGQEHVRSYFEDKGFSTIIPYDEMLYATQPAEKLTEATR